MSGLRPAAGVAVIDAGDTTYIARLPLGPIAVLEGVAAVIWAEACTGDRESLASRVSAVFETPVEGIVEHIDRFVADLIARGLLEARVGGPVAE